MKKVEVNDIRKALFRHMGSKVVVKENKGRHKYDVNKGIIKEVYPYIFMIEIWNKSEESMKMVSYSYTDVITKDVQLTLCNS